jgi:error-prone DNA polymerase
MRIAVVAADYSPGEADQLRRDMAAWRRTGRIEQHRGRLVSRMQAKGIAPEFAERIFQQICGFGEYGFPESHAASFALISYAAAYLRRHFPAEFGCAVLNAQPMGFYSIATLVEDAKRHGVEVRPLDVQASAWDCTLEDALADAQVQPFAVRMGLRFVRGLGAGDGEAIASARASGPWTSLDDLVRRTGLAERPLAALASAGAFDGLGIERRPAQGTSCVAEKTHAAPPRSRKSPRVRSDGFGNHRLITVHVPQRADILGPLRRSSRRGLPDARHVVQMKDGSCELRGSGHPPAAGNGRGRRS